MGRIWSDDSKFAAWARVEFGVLEAMGIDTSQFIDVIARIDPARISEYEKRTQHDMNAFLRHLSELLPEEARAFLHKGLTSYDVEDTALGLLLRGATSQILEELRLVKDMVWERACEHKHTLQIGRTHGVHAEPITFGFKLLNWYAELDWYEELIVLLRRYWEVGKISGAVGTYAHIDPSLEEQVARELSLFLPGISTQIIPRGRFGLYLSVLALLAGSLEKFATDIRLMSQTEIGEVKEGKGVEEQGSSAMPHKSAVMFANPIKSENICALARYVRALTIPAYENQVTWHERDIANSANERMIFKDASIAIDFMLFRFRNVMENLRVFSKKMRENLNLSKGTIFSGEVLSALMQKGMSRDEAYALVRELVLQNEDPKTGKPKQPFKKVVLANTLIRAQLSAEEIEQCFDPQRQLVHINSIFEKFEKKRNKE
jgi:adenylosuccinate lyase